LVDKREVFLVLFLQKKKTSSIPEEKEPKKTFASLQLCVTRLPP
jgi:hypothetical protein